MDEKQLVALGQVAFYTRFGNVVPNAAEFKQWLETMPKDQAGALQAEHLWNDGATLGDTLLVKLDECLFNVTG